MRQNKLNNCREWRFIKGFNYLISNKGDVMSLYKNEILKVCIAGNGYSQVLLCDNKKRINKTIHRLVASSFIENKLNKPQVNHIDGNKQNNNVDNLEWCTRNENMKHAYKKGLSTTKNKRAVNMYDFQGNFIKRFDSITSAGKHTKYSSKCGYPNIGECCRGKRNNAYGFIWRFANAKTK